MRKPLAFSLRRMEAGDFPAWAAMRHALWPEESLAGLRRELPALMNKRKFRAWIAERDKTPVGFVEAYVREFANGCEGQPVAFLEGIWVHPRQRRQGLGKALLGAVERWALAQGLQELGSDAMLRNPLSQRCHRAWGFAETERVVYFRKGLKNPRSRRAAP